MWTISKCVVMIILSVLSLMDYKIRKVPRDVMISCLAGAVIYRIVFVRMDWRLALAGALVGGIFVGISKFTKEAIGQFCYCNSWNLSWFMGTSGSAGKCIYCAWACRAIYVCSTEEKRKLVIAIFPVPYGRVSIECSNWKMVNICKKHMTEKYI